MLSCNIEKGLSTCPQIFNRMSYFFVILLSKTGIQTLLSTVYDVTGGNFRSNNNLVCVYVGIYVFLSVSYCLPFLSYFTNAGFHSVVNCFLSFWLGELQCVRLFDLSWADIDSLQVEVAVVKKDSPNPEDLMPTDVQNIIGEFADTNKKLFLQFELK